MNILGIHYGHNATVALVKDGKLVFAMSEERLNRLKNSNGFPVMVLNHIYENLVNPEEIDLAVLFQNDIAGYLEQKRVGFKSVRNFGATNVNFSRRYSLLRHILSKASLFFWALGKLGEIKRRLYGMKDGLTRESADYYAKMLKLPPEKIISMEHHQSHAYACSFNLDPLKKTLLFTMDGEGDGASSLVGVYEKYNYNILSRNPVNVSMGHFFTEVTKLLGMIPNEHEFKVMGLAPYAKQEKARELYENHKNLLKLNDSLEFESSLPMNRSEYFLLEKLYGRRFDTIAAFAQIFLEEKVIEWVKAWIKKTGIRDLALSGGVFMSVKLNQKILELPQVESLFVMPSAADESTAIGAAAFGSIKTFLQKKMPIELESFKDLYFGIEYEDARIEEELRTRGFFEKYKIQKFTEEFAIEKAVARLLSENRAVARMKGRSEWGARALGNRSILANPSNRDTVRVINEMIKNRDFWMPFAASVLEEDEHRYLINSKVIKAPYMAITFETTPLAREHLMAAIHPYDFTCRPQIVMQDWNPSYYSLIQEFKNLTGIGAVLNTSFNLHGEPNVETPADAAKTFENSGLQYLALGNFLISKE